MTSLAADARRVPRWYSITLGILYCVLVAWLTLPLRAGWAEALAIAAPSSMVLIWCLRWNFRRSLATPLPGRGIGAWLVRFPAGRMLATGLVGAASFALACGLILTLIAPDIRAADWGLAAYVGALQAQGLIAWMVLRRRVGLADTPPVGTAG